MGLTASLDMGSEKMVMALASEEADGCRLVGIKIIASQGIEHGIVRDKDKVRACIRSLVAELVKDRSVDVVHVALSGKAIQVSERRVTVPLQKRVVEQNDLYRAEQRCADGFEGSRDELVDIIPVAYAVDRGELIADPIGKQGRNLEVTFQVYLASYDYLSELRQLFDGTGIDEVVFYPVVRAYTEALDVKTSERDFALVDLGAKSMKVVLFRDRMLEYEVYLPLGMRTVDLDIMAAFALNAGQARKLNTNTDRHCGLFVKIRNFQFQIPA